MRKKVLGILLTVIMIIGISLPAMAQENGSIKVVLPTAKYQVSEKIVKINNGNQIIVGTFTTPKNAKGPYPTILILHGFNGQRNEMQIKDSNETMFGKTARVFTEQGYATLRIDFVGSGESSGKWEDTTFSSQISDAEAALNYLTKQSEVDNKRIGMLGLSQGGLVTACTAGRNPIVKSVILWSPVANIPSTYAHLLGNDALEKGLKSNDDKAIIAKLPWGGETALKPGFFKDIYNINPIGEVSSYRGPLQVVVGVNDTIVTPQPQSGELYIKYHKTENDSQEELIKLQADHMLDILSDNKEPLNKALFEGLNWLNKTLK